MDHELVMHREHNGYEFEDWSESSLLWLGSDFENKTEKEREKLYYFG